MTSSDIVLCTLNARWSHTSLALRWLKANLGPFEERSTLLELVIGIRTTVAVEKILALGPRIVGFSVYIWNVEQTTAIVRLLKLLAPQIKVVVGGPEVSYEPDTQPLCALADHVVSGPGEFAFQRLCEQLLVGPKPLMKQIPGDSTSVNHLAQLASPYALYTDTDIAHRLTYFEASRGCPFRCEFCLSSLDKTAWGFELDRVLAELKYLYERGARTFKFIDRTFNLKIDTSRAILQFFLDRQNATDPVFAHFEVIPDHLPEALRELIIEFVPGALQFEIGIQTLNPAVQGLISRRQDNAKAEANIRWLVETTHVHLHLDLIAGLPGEDMASFGRGFDALVDWLGLARGNDHDIQLGVLKRLRGTPIVRHTEAFTMTYSPAVPYEVLKTRDLSFAELQELNRMASYWDMLQRHPGLTQAAIQAAFEPGPFNALRSLSRQIHETTDSTMRIEPRRFQQLFEAWRIEANNKKPAEAGTC
jgi:radical SAM superfamily enzyme YgiQ (UPF0313 family)